MNLYPIFTNEIKSLRQSCKAAAAVRLSRPKDRLTGCRLRDRRSAGGARYQPSFTRDGGEEKSGAATKEADCADLARAHRDVESETMGLGRHPCGSRALQASRRGVAVRPGFDKRLAVGGRHRRPSYSSDGSAGSRRPASNGVVSRAMCSTRSTFGGVSPDRRLVDQETREPTGTGMALEAIPAAYVRSGDVRRHAERPRLLPVPGAARREHRHCRPASRRPPQRRGSPAAQTPQAKSPCG